MTDTRRNWLLAAAVVVVLALLWAFNLEQIGQWMDRNGVVLRQGVVTGLLIGGDAGLKSRHVQSALRRGQVKAMQLIARPG